MFRMIINCIYCHFFVIGKLINFTFVDVLVEGLKFKHRFIYYSFLK